jgi:hypothetical protein
MLKAATGQGALSCLYSIICTGFIANYVHDSLRILGQYAGVGIIWSLSGIAGCIILGRYAEVEVIGV